MPRYAPGMTERTAVGVDPDGVQRFAAAWTAFENAVDWSLLGRLHCDEGGDDFFAPSDREALFEAGLRFAEDLGTLLSPGGTTLWLGASVAECVPLLAATLVGGRHAQWFEREGPVLAELERGLEAAEAACERSLPRPRYGAPRELARGSCDHLWAVSVFTDPDAFPALHDQLYDRRKGPLATRRGSLPEERRRADELVRDVLQALESPGLLSTTDEELALFAPQCELRGRELVVPEEGRLSAIVGDTVRHCRVVATSPRRSR